MNPYRVLGVSPLDNISDIKSEYRKLCKQYHPDMPNGDEEKFKQINDAWEFINTHTVSRERDGYWSHKTLFNVERRSF